MTSRLLPVAPLRSDIPDRPVSPSKISSWEPVGAENLVHDVDLQLRVVAEVRDDHPS
jgi:hypothetical protein